MRKFTIIFLIIITAFILFLSFTYQEKLELVFSSILDIKSKEVDELLPPLPVNSEEALPEVTPEVILETPDVEHTPSPTPTPKPSDREEASINSNNSKELPKSTTKPSDVSEVPSNNGVKLENLPEIPDEYTKLAYYDIDKSSRYRQYKALNTDFTYEKAILFVNIGLDAPFYTNILQIDRPNDLSVLVNKYHKLPSNYEPKLVEVPASMCVPGMGKQYLRKEALASFEKMHLDAKELGLNITAYGTYRSIELQNNIWKSKVNSGRSIEDVDSLNSRGGHSEHHTGLAVDVIKNNYTTENTKEFAWYIENAHNYGFILRYPKGKEDITGYKYEPWHLRYIGEELAKKVYESGLTYEEYYAMVIEPNR